MKSIIKKLLAPRQIEYLTMNQDWLVLETSYGVQRLADRPREALPGKDVRLSFPELIGLEDILISVLEQEQDNFQLKGVARCVDKESPLYIDLYVISDREETTKEKNLMLLVEDVTEKMVTQQALIQAANESNLLLSALAASKDYIDKVITSMTDVLLVTNRDGLIKNVNQAAQNLFGYSENELIGRSISTIIPEPHLLHKARHSQIYLLQKNNNPEDLEVVCQTKNNEKIILEFSFSAIQTDVKGLLDFVYIGRDITIRKLHEEELNLALQKERELRELRTRFFSMVTHEFGNPLNTILFSSELLKNYDNDITEEEKIQYIDFIQETAKHTIELLNDIRFIGSADSGKLECKPSSVNLIKFCSNLVEAMKISTSKDHKIQLAIANNSAQPKNIESADAKDDLLLLDEKLLRHILTNLLSNAIKYSPPKGTIYFDLILHPKEAIFQVKDEGIGIPAENQKYLFQSFYRANNVGKIPGTGLGLAIVKQCVDLQGGQIEVESEIDKGTTFKVILPLQKVE